MLSKLFQPDKGWYDEKTRRLKDLIPVSNEPNYQMNTLMGDIPWQK